MTHWRRADSPTELGVDIRPVATAAELKRFIRVAALVHAGDPAWVPPLLMERRQALDKRRHPYFRHAEVALWIARRDGRDVGRISAQIDRRAEPGTGFFGMLGAIDDAAVFDGLIGTAEAWLKARGITRVLGPFNLSINQEAGLLVDGFATPPMLLMGHDRPWVSRHLAASGYVKAKDLYAFIGEMGRAPPAALARTFRTASSTGATLRPLRMKTYRDEVIALTAIFNDAWSENWGFVPFAPDEVDHMARHMRPLIDERLVWFAEVDGSPAAFAVCLPNINEAIHDLDGRLLPLGWARLLWRLKLRGVTSARIPLMGVRRRYSSTIFGSRLAFMVLEALHRECAARGITTVEMSWVLEDNSPTIRLIEALGGRRYKTYRIYEKHL